MTRLYFFATGNDISAVLSTLEERFSVAYFEGNRLSGAIPQRWKSVLEVPSLGCATADQEILCRPYLIMRADAKEVVNSLVMFDGHRRYDLYQEDNPESVSAILGGYWKDGSLISGHFVASSDQEFPKKLMAALRKAMRGSFKRIGAFWVGPEALARLRDGKRLCTAIQSPPEYDLHEEPLQNTVS